jgi:signal transduction histidine kinase
VKVLIVEDEATDRLMLRSAVQQLGHDCLVAASGAEAWELFGTHQPDVVISDWRMPGVDGVELCRRIRAAEWSTYTPFIFVTGLTDRVHALAAIEIGADDYLTKPLDISELRARLMAAGRLKRAEGRVIERTAALQAAIRDLESERHSADKMKDEFLSVVNHELRTPLTSIRGSLGMLTGGLIEPQSEKGQRLLEIALGNTNRLIRLINDILDVERMQSGAVSMSREACNTADLMIHAADAVRGMAQEVDVVLDVSPHRAQLWGDPHRLVQVLTNVLSNAIKFSPRGATVSLSAHEVADGVVVVVTDAGRGIPADKLEAIFERFEQVDVSDARQKGGTGLGLAISRSIIQKHGGRIWAESTLGKGSTFRIRLPGRRADAAVQAAQAAW